MKRFFTIATVLVMVATSVVAAAKNNGILFEYVGQVTNSGASSTQFGNLTGVSGPDGAYFTFYTTATNSSVTVNGPLRIIDRVGTTTIYLNSAPGDFANSDSFRSGIPVQVSELRQQVVVNTSTGLFTVLNINSVDSATDVGEMFGDENSVFRTVLTGQLNSAGASPTGWFGGYAVSTK